MREHKQYYYNKDTINTFYVIPFAELIQFQEALGQVRVAGAPDFGGHPQRLHILALLKVLHDNISTSFKSNALWKTNKHKEVAKKEIYV